MSRTIGFQTGTHTDETRRNWQNDGPRPIAWAAWYPTDAAAAPRQIDHFFDIGPVLPAAAPSPGPHPLALISHGTGGTAEGLAWLARALAEAGYIVLGAQHHGNCGLEPYTAEGFLAWWERAADLSCLLSAQLAGAILPAEANPARISAIGFSLGGYTALALAGAITDMDAFLAWNAAQNTPLAGPREFPNAAEELPGLRAASAPFAASWQRHNAPYTDPRITGFVAIAPAPTVRAFTPASLAAIAKPVALFSGGADTEAPMATCAGWLCAQNPAFRHTCLGQTVGHYAFLSRPANPAKHTAPFFTDPPGFNRTALQTQAARHILHTLAQA